MTSRKTTAAALLAAGAMTAALPSAYAHHALEFIDVSSYTLTGQGESAVYLIYDHKTDDADDPGSERWEFTPGLSYGVTDWLMVDAHTHYAKFGPNYIDQGYLNGLAEDVRARTESEGAAAMLEAAAVSAQVALPRFNDFVDVGFSLAMEIPFSQAEEVLGSDTLGYSAELILRRELPGHRMITANLINVMEDEGDGYEHSQEWRLGFRTPVSPNPEGIAVGLELSGSFDEGDWFFMPGVYAPITSSVMAKMGLQMNGDEMEAHRFHASLMYLF